MGLDVNEADKTALVTGANSGVGFEAAAQLAEDGWGRVILACRSIEKAETAKARLVERTGKDPFDVLVVDTSEVASAHAACDELRDRGERIDFLLLLASEFKAFGFEDPIQERIARTLLRDQLTGKQD